MRVDLSPTDTLHLTALRGAIARAQYLAVKGARRSEVVTSYMQGAAHAAHTLGIDISAPTRMIGERGWREVLTQLHILEGRK